jgi:membrane protease YdiL (CAAX protease family)
MKNPSTIAISNRGRFGKHEIIALIWTLSAIALTFLATSILQGSFSIFTFLTLVILLGILIRNRDAVEMGFRSVKWSSLFKYTGINLLGSLGLMIIFEPWSHTYQMLISEAISSPRPDTTFGWIVLFPGVPGWLAFIFFAGFVSLFAEEFFFRGWLLNWLKRRMSEKPAILMQATIFTIPQALAALLLPPTQGLLYVFIYSWIAIGLIGGWVASRTQSICPSLLSATIYNLTMCLLVL